MRLRTHTIALRLLAEVTDRFRQRYHPLYWLRQSTVFRWFSSTYDRPIWVRIDRVRHPVRVAALRNAGYLFHRPPEPKIAALFATLLQTYEVNTFWDIGANVGYYSWLAASTQPSLNVVAIEPDAANFSLLRATQTRYAPQVTVINAAISSRDGTHAFLVDNITGATGTLETDRVTFNQHNYREIGATEVIQTRSLDSLMAEYGRPDMLKIDVEGHEAAVLDGGAALLKTFPIIVIEAAEESGALARLRENGYLIVAAETLCVERASDWNYLALPPEHALRVDILRARCHTGPKPFGR